MKNQKNIITIITLAVIIAVVAVLMVWVVWYYKTNVKNVNIPTMQTSGETNTNTVVNVNDTTNVNAVVNANLSADVNAEPEATETDEEDTPTTTVATSIVTVSKTFTEAEPMEMTTLNEFSIATTAKVKESRGITLRDVQVALYDSELFDTQYGPGMVSDLKCNDDYCLMTIRRAGWQYRVLKFADGEFTDLSELIPNFDVGNTGHIKFIWTGDFWFINGGEHLLKYDGMTMTQIDLPIDLSIDMAYPRISSIGWNGEYLLVAYSSSYCAGQGIFQFIHVDTSGNIIETHEALRDYNCPTVGMLSWNGSNEWLVSGSYHTGIVFDQNPILIRYSTTGEMIEDFSESIPTRRWWIDQIFWDGTRWLIGFADTDSPYIPARLYSYSPTDPRLVELIDFLIGFDQAGISAIDGRPDFYTIVGDIKSVANVVRNGQVRDLSDYFAMYVSSGTTQDDKVVIGGEGQLEVLSFDHYEPKRTYTSDQINEDGEKVVAVTLTPKHILPAETSITYEVTNNYGASWYTVEPRVEFVFPEEGQHLLWRAVLQTRNNTLTPSMSSMEVSYVKLAD